MSCESDLVTNWEEDARKSTNPSLRQSILAADHLHFFPPNPDRHRLAKRQIDLITLLRFHALLSKLSSGLIISSIDVAEDFSRCIGVPNAGSDFVRLTR